MPKTPGDEIRRMTVPFEVKAVKESSDGRFAGEFEGYAAGIHNIDRVGDMIIPGAFIEDLPRFLREGVVCWQHDWTAPIGSPLEAREDAYGLFTKCRVSNTTQGKDAMTLIRDRVVKKLSIGYRVARNGYEWVDRAGLIAYLAGTDLSEEERRSIVQQYDEMELDELFLLKKIRLFEYSPVSVPANTNAMITDAKGLLAGLSFGDQLQAVLATVKEITTHAEQIKALREKEGRKLGVERRGQLQEVASDLQALAARIEELARVKTEPESQDAARLFAEFQLIEARTLGCAA